MIGPWKRIKMAWYKRQAKRAIWFLRYLDRTIQGMGWGREKCRQFWLDFYKYPEARRKAMNDLAVINKIKIKELRHSRMEKTIDWLKLSNQKLQIELNKALAKCAQYTQPGEDPGAPKEETHEVPIIRPAA
jgi:hypothetical protein